MIAVAVYLRARLWLVAAALVLAAGQAVASDICRPLHTIALGRIAEIDREWANLSPRLEAQTAVDLVLIDSPDAFGLSSTTKVVTLSRSIPVLSQRIGALVDDRATLLFDKGANDSVVLLSDGRRHLLRVVDGIPRTADDQIVEVAPLMVTSRAFTLSQGSRLELDANGKVRLLKGARVVWDLATEPTVNFTMLRPARLEETSAQPGTPHVTPMKPARVLPGGLLHVQVQSPGFDFRNKLLNFCFSGEALSGAQVFSHATRGKLIAESNDGAVFEIRIPTELADELLRGASGRSKLASLLGDQWLGHNANLRVIAFDGERVVVDAVTPFVVSDAFLAIVAGMIVITLLLLMSALFLREPNPFAIVDRLVRHSSQRYSLSNVQILMWTLLVIFALCYVWVANGILLAISSGVLALLGISGATSVLARTVEGYGTQPQDTLRREPKLKDLVVTPDGDFDLLRFQMLGFTLFTWFYSLISVIRSEGLPEIPENMYVLMGISNAAYIGGKIADNAGDKSNPAVVPADATQTNEFERAMSEKDVRNLQAGLGIAVTGSLDETTRQAVQTFKLDHGIVPANTSVNSMLLDMIGSGP